MGHVETNPSGDGGDGPRIVAGNDFHGHTLGAKEFQGIPGVSAGLFPKRQQGDRPQTRGQRRRLARPRGRSAPARSSVLRPVAGELPGSLQNAGMAGCRVRAAASETPVPAAPIPGAPFRGARIISGRPKIQVDAVPLPLPKVTPLHFREEENGT